MFTAPPEYPRRHRPSRPLRPRGWAGRVSYQPRRNNRGPPRSSTAAAHEGAGGAQTPQRAHAVTTSRHLPRGGVAVRAGSGRGPAV